MELLVAERQLPLHRFLIVLDGFGVPCQRVVETGRRSVRQGHARLDPVLQIQ